jgi:hypothetical protein
VSVVLALRASARVFRSLPHNERRQALKTISEFCEDKRLSRAKYFEMRRQGRGPVEARDGKWVRISPQAEERWDRERESESESARQDSNAA